MKIALIGLCSLLVALMAYMGYEKYTEHNYWLMVLYIVLALWNLHSAYQVITHPWPL